MARYKLHVIENGNYGGEEEFRYTAPYDLDDMLGILKTFMEHADHSSSFVFTVVREKTDAEKETETEERRLKEMGQSEEDGLAYFDRYIAGDR